MSNIFNNKMHFAQLILSITTIVFIANGTFSLGSIFLIGCFLIFLLLSKKEKINVKLLLTSLIVGFVFALMMVIGHFMYIHMNLNDFININELFKIIVYTFAFTSALISIFKMLQKLPLKSAKFVILNKWWLTFGILMLCWLPVFLASYPGSMTYDVPTQIQGALMHQYNNRQPFLEGYILTKIIIWGKSIFGSWSAGCAFFVIIQMSIAALAATWVIKVIINFGTSKFKAVCILLFYAFYPLISLFVINGDKDVLGGIFTTIAVTALYVRFYCSQNEQRRLSKNKKILLDLITTLFLFLELFYRNNNIYAFILFIPFLLILYRKQIIRGITMIVVILTAYFVITGPYYTSIHVNNNNKTTGDAVETFALPLQQLKIAYAEDGNHFSKIDKKTIHKIFGPGTPEQFKTGYYPRNTDKLKFDSGINTPNNDYLSSKKGEKQFFKTYISIFRQCPKLYVESFLNLTLGYWYPGFRIPDIPQAVFGRSYIEYANNTIFIQDGHGKKFSFGHKPILFKQFHNWLFNFTAQGTYQKWGLVSVLFVPSLFIWVTVFVFAQLFLNKRLYNMLPMMLVMMQTLTIFAGPVLVIRYIFPLIFAFPFLFFINDLKKREFRKIKQNKIG